VTVTFLADEAELPPRVAYAVGKRVGTAVARNRVRRRLRAGVTQRHQRPTGALPSGDYLVSAGAGAVTCSWPELTGHLERAIDAAIEPAPPTDGRR
jgi:ribonuclease P protein component